MARLISLQHDALIRLRGQFEGGATTHGPLRCVLVHQEGVDFSLPLSPPACEQMPALAKREESLYSYRPGEPFTKRVIYLLRNHKRTVSLWPIDPKALQAALDWQELSQRTQQSWDDFRRLAGDAGRCFGAHDGRTLPEVARESLEASGDVCRWLWIVFDLAWQKIKGSPLQADRLIWRDVEGEGGHFYAWELNTARYWASQWEIASSPQSGPDEAKRVEKLAYLKTWAERPPGSYYSSLDDLFSASVWAIDILTDPDSTAAISDNLVNVIGRALKEPSGLALESYRLRILQGQKQTAIAEMMSNEHGKAISQGQVSRWVKEVREYLEAGHVLPDMEAKRKKGKAHSTDPSKLDYQENPDGRFRPRQSPQRRDGEED